MNRTARTLLAIVATDRTFERVVQRGREVWSGKCIHCNRRLAIGLDGTPISRATIEHIVPRNHGGDDAIENLAIACAGCNHEKGRRHDKRRSDDPELRTIVERLQRRRMKRWRAPES